MIRCFLAIKLPQISSYLPKIEQLSEFANLRVVQPKHYHLTIHFFGKVSTQKLEQLKKLLKGFSFDKFTINFGKTGAFPSNSKQNLRVLYIDLLDGKTELRELKAKLGKQLQSSKIEADSRSYSPHLTVARVKRISSPSKLNDGWLNTSIKQEIIRVEKMHLISSTLRQDGPYYENLQIFDFQ